ncbi:MAG: hypothetical protein LC624_11855 [Halobacteriales archaeon]|nr:hypothetical protein [Halobacteriales archaeon]
MTPPGDTANALPRRAQVAQMRRASAALLLLLLAGLGPVHVDAVQLPFVALGAHGHNPIVIEGDGAWCEGVNAQGLSRQGVDCAGTDGTQARPYLIQGWRINMAVHPPGSAAIRIVNTTKWWTIQDVTLTDTNQERSRDGIVLVGASIGRGSIVHSTLSGLRDGVRAGELMYTHPCASLPGDTFGLCFTRIPSAPRISDTKFSNVARGIEQGGQLGFPWNPPTTSIQANDFDGVQGLAYEEVEPTFWRPGLSQNWWGSPLGPGHETVLGLDVGGAPVKARCADGADPLRPPQCITPWLPGPNPAAGPVSMDLDG